MPTVRNHRSTGQSPQRGYHSKSQIERFMGPAVPRDDLSQAYAGVENEGPFGDPKTNKSRRTHLKARKTAKSRTRTPVR